MKCMCTKNYVKYCYLCTNVLRASFVVDWSPKLGKPLVTRRQNSAKIIFITVNNTKIQKIDNVITNLSTHTQYIQKCKRKANF